MRRPSSLSHASSLRTLSLHVLWSMLLTAVIGLASGPIPAFAAGKPAPKLPPAQRIAIQPQAQQRAPIRGLSPQQARAFQAGGLSKYAIVSTAPAGRIAMSRLHLQNATVLMPDLARYRLVRMRSGGHDAGIVYNAGDVFTLVLAGRGGRAIGTLSMSRGGMLTISIDPDRNGVADYVEEWRGQTSLTTYVRDGLGERFLDAMMAGRNPFCASGEGGAGTKPGIPGLPGMSSGSGPRAKPAAGGGAGGDWLSSFDARAGLDMCGGGGARVGGGGTVGGTKGGPVDPMALACAEFGESLSRPARFSPRIQADDDVDAGPISDTVDAITSFIPDTGAAAALGAIAKALIDRYGEGAIVSAMESLGFPSAEALAAESLTAAEIGTVSAEAAAAALTAALAAAAAFLAITFTPATAHAADCETSRAGCGSGGTSGGSSTDRPNPEGGMGGDGAFREFCRRRQDQRQEWQHVVDDQRERNFTQCVDPVSGDGTNDRSAFCRFLQSAMNPETADPTTAGAFDGDGRGPIDSPFDRVKQRLEQARRSQGDLRIITCDPTLCQPVP